MVYLIITSAWPYGNLEECVAYHIQDKRRFAKLLILAPFLRSSQSFDIHTYLGIFFYRLTAPGNGSDTVVRVVNTLVCLTNPAPWEQHGLNTTHLKSICNGAANCYLE
jgi:hypothetical protein